MAEIIDGEIMVEDWSSGICRGMRGAHDYEARRAIVEMIKDLQDEVADLKSRLCIAARGL